MKRSGRKSSMKGEIEYDASESITIGGPPSLSENKDGTKALLLVSG